MEIQCAWGSTYPLVSVFVYVSESYDAAPFIKSEHMSALSDKDNRQMYIRDEDLSNLENRLASQLVYSWHKSC